MKNSIQIAAILAAFMPSLALGQMETGHYPAGAEGLKAASLPPPGKYLKWYNFYYTSRKLTGPTGSRVNTDFELDVFATAPRLIWMTDRKLFGADYGVDILIPYLQVDVKAGGTHNSASGIGDIFFEPAVLGWHGDDWDIGAAVGLWVPTGEFEVNSLANVGKDFWTTMLTLGATGYIDREKTWSVSALGRYEINSKKSEIAVQPGDDFHIEWGVGKTVSSNWTVGLTAYTHWQVTDDRGGAVTWDPGVHDRFGSLGPEISYASDDSTCFIALRYQREFAAVDRPEGYNTVLSLVKVF